MDWNEELDGIAVVGMAGRFPRAAGVGELWHNLTHDVEGVSTFDTEELRAEGVSGELLARPEYVPAAGVLEGIDRFDADFFGFSPREAEILDPQHRLFLENAWHALEDAGLDSSRPGSLGSDARVGVFAGSGLNAYFLLHVHPNRELLEVVGAYAAVLATDEDFLTTRTSYKLDLTGPSISVQTACSSSLVAVGLACSSLMNGECDVALAGGVTVRLPHRAGYLYQEQGILSPDGRCRPFDAAARGTVPASGVGLVTLKRLSDAVADGDTVRAVLRGWAINNDGGKKVGYTAPRADGQEAAILEALALAGFDPATVGYVEGHGTGTAVGDPIEVAALTRAFRAHTERRGYCSLGSLKGHLGHLDGAAGGAGLIKAVLAVEQGTVPGTLHFQRPNPALQLDASPFMVHSETRPWSEEVAGGPRRAGVSSFGIGGTNAHVVLEQAPAASRGAGSPDPGPQLIALSACSADALPVQSQALAVHLRALDAETGDSEEEETSAQLADIAHTLAAGRRILPRRRAWVLPPGTSLAAGAEALESEGMESAVAQEASGTQAEAAVPELAFLLPGQGSQYVGMAAGLYRRYQVFQRALDQCAEVLQPILDLDLRRVLFPEPGAEERAASVLASTAVTQPAIFSVGYAASRLWASWGVEAGVLLGHSVGEYLAASLAGVFHWRDALELVAERGRLMASLPPGAMATVQLPEEELASWLERHPAIHLAAVNGPAVCAVGGPPEALDALLEALEEEQVHHRRLHVDRAFHSPDLDPLLEDFAQRVATVPRQAPTKAFLSCVTGTWISAYDATDPEYWARQLRQPVRFSAAAAALLEGAAGKGRRLLELGPGEALTTLMRQQPAFENGQRAASGGRHPQDPRDDATVILEASAALWVDGVPVRLEALTSELRLPEPHRPEPHRPEPYRRRVPLPLYPFQRQSYWVEATTPVSAPERGKRADRESWFYAPGWQSVTEPPVAVEEPDEPSPRRWLLLTTGGAPEQEWTTSLAAGLGTVAHPAPTSPAPESSDQARELFRELAEGSGTPTDVALLTTPPTAPAADGAEAQEHLLHLVHGLAQEVHRETVRLTVVTHGALGVLGTEAAGGAGAKTSAGPDANPTSQPAALAGLLRCIPQEHSNLHCRLLDLPAPNGDGISREIQRLLLEELQRAEADTQAEILAFRGAHRWHLHLGAFPLPAPAAEAALLPAGAHVLITGGLGHFGLLLAEHLQRRCGARLSLLDPRSPSAAEKRRLESLESVAVLAADVADADQLSAALATGRERFGGYDAVFHCAGFGGDDSPEAPFPTPYQTVAETGGDFLRVHRRPKVRGLQLLDRLLAEQDPSPATAVVATSLAPILGGLGLAAYAAADAAVDAFAERRAGRLPWCSVNWEGWEAPLEGADSLAAGSLGAGSLGAAQSALTLDDDELLDSVDRVLAALAGGPGGPGGPRRLAVATGDLETRRRQWSRAGREAAGGGAGNARTTTHQAPYRAPETATEETVVAIWQELLGVEAVGLDDDFFMLGGSSLVGLQVISKLRAELDVEMPLRTFFEARTATALAREIDSEKAQKQAEAARMDELLAEIENLSPEEVEALLAEEEG
ncbi:MAG: SDR family NAD(P)-dependent oxidoreductase [Acidobacteriota bacterium]|nr:SDR family NAD(P)-dependent oxidoreductase [Acidobacteriota bacterium]